MPEVGFNTQCWIPGLPLTAGEIEWLEKLWKDSEDRFKDEEMSLAQMMVQWHWALDNLTRIVENTVRLEDFHKENLYLAVCLDILMDRCARWRGWERERMFLTLDMFGRASYAYLAVAVCGAIKQWYLETQSSVPPPSF